MIAPLSTSSLSRHELIERSNRYLPTTSDGLTAGFYRADLVPTDVTQKEALNPSLLDAAFVELSYEEGFPALPDGRPYWHKLDYEPPEAFILFELYTHLGTQGPRYLQQLLDIPEAQQILPNLSMAQLRELYTLYYWRDRSRAFDLYQEAAYRHIRSRRAQSAENYHYEKAESLLNHLVGKIGANLNNFFDQLILEPDKAITVMEKLIRIQRISAGLPAQAPLEALPNKQQGQLTDFEMILRQVAQRNAPIEGSTTSSHRNIHHRPSDNNESHTIDEQGKVISTTDNLLRGALNDPNTARLLQEVIIRVSSTQGPTKQPKWMQQQRGHQPADPDPSDFLEEGSSDV